MDAFLPVTSNPLWLVWNILKQSLDDLAIQDFPVAMFVWVMAHCNRWEIYIFIHIQSYIHTSPYIFHGISTEILWVAKKRHPAWLNCYRLYVYFKDYRIDRYRPDPTEARPSRRGNEVRFSDGLPCCAASAGFKKLDWKTTQYQVEMSDLIVVSEVVYTWKNKYQTCGTSSANQHCHIGHYLDELGGSIEIPTLEHTPLL